MDKATEKERKERGEKAKQPEKNFSEKVGKAFDKKYLAERIIELQPCYYDKARNWWLWDWKKTKWTRVDETDILNAVETQANINTINSKERTEMLEAIKQVSRKHAPQKLPSHLIQFKDVIYNLETGNRLRVDPEMFVTNPIPYELDKDGYFETPTMDKIFEEWVGKDNILLLKEIIAYCLIPDYPIHRIFCFIGEGLNGKGKFLELIRKFIGKENCCSTELDTLLHSRFEVTRLHRKLVCQIGETNFNELSKTSMLKKLCGGDLIGFEYKRKDPFEDINYAKILIATNNLPATADKTKGFYRRWMIINFFNQFNEKVDILNTIPEKEYNALAVKCTFILKDLLKEREFTNEGTIEEREKKYEDHSNPFEKFLKEFTEENHNSTIWKWDFEKKLNQWCNQNRFRNISGVTIGKKMKEHEIQTIQKIAGDFANGKKLRAWSGIKWKEENNESEQE